MERIFQLMLRVRSAQHVFCVGKFCSIVKDLPLNSNAARLRRWYMSLSMALHMQVSVTS